jgi:putrescine transport system substrate-binding protein
MKMLKSILLCAAFVSGVAHAEEKTLRVYNWFDYITPKALEDFKSQHPDIKLVYDIFDTNEALEAKLLTGSSWPSRSKPGCFSRWTVASCRIGTTWTPS